jgi:O-antigen/teichoic acid export membrane protein
MALLMIVPPRWLGPAAFGDYMAACAFVSIFRILPDAGAAYASTLDISRDRSLAARRVGELLGLQAVLSVVALLLCAGLGAWIYADARVIRTAIFVLSIDLVLRCLKTTLRWLLRGLEAFGTEAASLLIERTALVVLGLGVLAAGGGVFGFVLVFALVHAVDTAGLCAFIHRRVAPLVPRRDAAAWGALLSKGLPFAYASLMITLFFQIDAVLLERLRGSAEAGWYRAPVTVLEGLQLVPRILSFALLPTMAAIQTTAPATVAALYRRGSKYLLVAGLPIGVFGLLASDAFMTLLFGAEFVPSATASILLLPAAVFMFLSNFGETVLLCLDRIRTVVVVSTVALTLNVALNLWWIPRHGFVGAAAATLVTEAAYFVLGAIALHRLGHRAAWLALLVRPIAATAIFTAVLWLGRPMGLIPASVLASLAFALATFAFGVWDQRERALMRETWARLSGRAVAGRL